MTPQRLAELRADCKKLHDMPTCDVDELLLLVDELTARLSRVVKTCQSGDYAECEIAVEAAAQLLLAIGVK
jgi:hypothetical protein